MGAGNHDMLWIRHKNALLLRFCTPKHKNDSTRFCIGNPNHSIREKLPWNFMGIGTMGPYGQRSIEHEQPLASPRLKASVIWYATPKVIPQFKENILE